MSISMLPIHQHIALRWSAKVVGFEGYKHSAPLEPEQVSVAVTPEQNQHRCFAQGHTP